MASHVTTAIEHLIDGDDPPTDDEIRREMKAYAGAYKALKEHREATPPRSGRHDVAGNYLPSKAEEEHADKERGLQSALAHHHDRIDEMLRSRGLDPITDEKHIKKFLPELCDDPDAALALARADTSGDVNRTTLADDANPWMAHAIQRGLVKHDDNWPAWFKLAVRRYGAYARQIGPEEFERQYGKGTVETFKREAGEK